MLPALALAVSLLAGRGDVPPVYRAVVLPGSSASAVDISSGGVAVGSIGNSAGSGTAAIWHADGELEVIGRLDTMEPSGAYGIAPGGSLVAGFAVVNPGTFPALWSLKQGTVTQLPVPHPSTGLAVNDAGFVLCRKSGPSGLLIGRDRSQYSIGGFVVGLDASGRVAGTDAVGPFRWTIQSGYEYLIPPLGYDAGEADGMGRDGSVCGRSFASAAGEWRATVWDVAGVPAVLATPLGFTTTDTRALDVSSAGAVGWSFGVQTAGDPETGETVGVLWVGSTGYQLADLLEQGSPVSAVTFAWAMNDAGQIVGVGRVNGQDRAVRLDPLP